MGAKTAPVTLVAFVDFECPYCAIGWQNMEVVRREFGPDKLRVVIKQLPLPFHPQAKLAARRALGLLRDRGQEAFFEFATKVFAGQRTMGEESLEKWSAEVAASVAPAPIRTELSVDEQLVRDRELAKSLSISATPTFLLNGRVIEGAEPVSSLAGLVRAELVEVARLQATGAPAEDIQRRRFAANFGARRGDEGLGAPEEDEPLWAIPVDDSPVEGPSSAAVTVVGFMDLECPHCKKGYQTLRRLRERYPDQLRIVWKHRPLAMHPHAEAASVLGIEARRQLGDAGFFAAASRLFAAQDDLGSEALGVVGEELGMTRDSFAAALASPASRERLDRDGELADALAVTGTPQFFVNGRRIRGAQPIESFTAVIDAQLAAADRLRATGTPPGEIGARLTRDAVPPPEPRTLSSTHELPEDPSLGPSGAPVTIHVFSDFQCAYCRQFHATLEELMRRYPTEVRLVWHELPLGFHERARPAAAAAREAYAQRGSQGYFEMARRLFSHQDDLSEERILADAAAIGLVEEAMVAQRREATHGARIDSDRALSLRLGISGTPTAIVGRYVVEGTQPMSRMDRLVRRVLKEVGHEAHP